MTLLLDSLLLTKHRKQTHTITMFVNKIFSPRKFKTVSFVYKATVILLMQFPNENFVNIFSFEKRVGRRQSSIDQN